MDISKYYNIIKDSTSYNSIKNHVTTIYPYAKTGLIVAVTGFFFKNLVITNITNFSLDLNSVGLPLITGGTSAWAANLTNDKVQKIAIIGLGLLASTSLTPVFNPFSSLPLTATVVLNLLAVAGNINLKIPNFNTINNSINYNSINYNSIKNHIKTIHPYAIGALILVITKVFCERMLAEKLFGFYLPSFVASLWSSIMICLTIGGIAGNLSTLCKDKIQKITIIGIGLLANAILIPEILPGCFHFLSITEGIVFNLLAASQKLWDKTGNPITKS